MQTFGIEILTMNKRTTTTKSENANSPITKHLVKSYEKEGREFQASQYENEKSNTYDLHR